MSSFEEIQQIDYETGREFWSARELSPLLDYEEWRNFSGVISKAKTSCQQSGADVNYHFVDVNKMIRTGKGAERSVADVELSRYACYLIVQNGDPKKPKIALGQTYFAIKTRKQELFEQGNIKEMPENQKRLALRGELLHHNKSLSAAAKDAGVETQSEHAEFHDSGYQGLYGGLRARDIHARKGLGANQNILDHMSSTELAANFFRVTQAEEKLRKDKITGAFRANEIHREVGKKVRQTMRELSGTVPEELPSPALSISQIKAKKALGPETETSTVSTCPVESGELVDCPRCYSQETLRVGINPCVCTACDEEFSPIGLAETLTWTSVHTCLACKEPAIACFDSMALCFACGVTVFEVTCRSCRRDFSLSECDQFDEVGRCPDCATGPVGE